MVKTKKQNTGIGKPIRARTKKAHTSKKYGGAKDE